MMDGDDSAVFRFLSLVTLTFDLDIQTRPSEGPNTSSLWIWRKSVQRFPRYLRHKQKSLYGLEAFSLTKTDLQSLDFVINRFFMKLFATSNTEIVKCCQEYFGFSPSSALLAKCVSTFESSFDRFILFVQWLSWRDFLGMLCCYQKLCHCLPFILIYAFVQCGYLYCLGYAIFLHSVFMINNDLCSVMIILWLVCDNVVSTV